MNSFFNKVKSAVSRDKNRYRFGKYDLDLTYITERIIGIVFSSYWICSVLFNLMNCETSYGISCYWCWIILSQQSWWYLNFLNVWILSDSFCYVCCCFFFFLLKKDVAELFEEKHADHYLVFYYYKLYKWLYKESFLKFIFFLHFRFSTCLKETMIIPNLKIKLLIVDFLIITVHHWINYLQL